MAGESTLVLSLAEQQALWLSLDRWRAFGGVQFAVCGADGVGAVARTVLGQDGFRRASCICRSCCRLWWWAICC